MRPNGPGETRAAPLGAILMIMTLAAGACATRQGPPSGIPVPAEDVERIAAGNRLRAPTHIVFAWTLQERDGRFTGQGVTRIAPPARARLDLFGPRGETYLIATMVDGRLHLPPGAPNVPLPPPELLWTALGVFEPPAGARLVDARRDGTTLRVDYENGTDRWRFRFEDGRLRHAEWTGRGEGRRTVELSGTGDLGLPATAEYRDWLTFSELRLILGEAREVDAFPADIWSLRSP
jgi:hypothetical protein